MVIYFCYGQKSEHYTMVPNMGYASVTVFAYNEFTDNKGTHEGVIQQTQGYFWVGDVMVLGQVLA